MIGEVTDFLTVLKGGGSPDGSSVPPIDSELHISYEGHSGGAENPPHLSTVSDSELKKPFSLHPRPEGRGFPFLCRPLLRRLS